MGERHKEEGKVKMDFPHSMATLVLLLLLASYVKAHVGLFYIRKYGAIPNWRYNHGKVKSSFNNWKHYFICKAHN